MPAGIFLDRDGVLNEVVYRKGVITSPRSWEEVKDCVEMERTLELKNLEYRLIMVTNQPEIARGLVDPDFVTALNQHYLEKHQLDGLYVCPYANDDHPMRKPNPGMLEQAARDHDLDLTKSFMVGDTVKDVGAANRAGVKALLVDRPYNQEIVADHRFRNFDELYEILVAERRMSRAHSETA